MKESDLHMCSRTVPKSTTLAAIATIDPRTRTVNDMVWVYGSVLMPNHWCAWDCLALTKEDLHRKCVSKYGRVPTDCVAREVHLSVVPRKFIDQLLIECQGA